MLRLDADIVVIGAGFGGTLAALLAHQLGRRVLLVDRGTHPRFAIGESSTPLANLVLEDLAGRYGLPWLKPFANYASWKQHAPSVDVGLKRGFSYFHHTAGQVPMPRADHQGELLVAASYGPDDADTHWHRADFDDFLVRQAVAAGIPYYERTVLSAGAIQPDGCWRLTGSIADEPCMIQAEFVVDASGVGGCLANCLQLPSVVHELSTHSRAVYAHWTNVAEWEPWWTAHGGRCDEHPFPCDAAALHHVFDGGWMWVLRFDSGVTSAGFSLDLQRHPLDPQQSPADEWQAWCARFAAIGEQFASAEPTTACGGIRRTGRLQRLVTDAAGPNWALLPNAAGFIDALHSTGNTHTLLGLERLAQIWERHWGTPAMSAALADYSRLIVTELHFIDRLVAGSYANFDRFDRFVALSWFYFAAAIWSEEERRRGRPSASFCQATDSNWCALLDQAVAAANNPDVSLSELQRLVNKAIAPINRAQLGDPAQRGMVFYPAPS